MSKIKNLAIAFLLAALILSACSGALPTVQPTGPQQEPAPVEPGGLVIVVNVPPVAKVGEAIEFRWTVNAPEGVVVETSYDSTPEKAAERLIEANEEGVYVGSFKASDTAAFLKSGTNVFLTTIWAWEKGADLSSAVKWDVYIPTVEAAVPTFTPTATFTPGATFTPTQTTLPPTAAPTFTLTPAATFTPAATATVADSWFLPGDMNRTIHKVDDSIWPQSVEAFKAWVCPTVDEYNPTPDALALMDKHGYIPCEDTPFEKVVLQGQYGPYHYFSWDQRPEGGSKWTLIVNRTGVTWLGFVSNNYADRPLPAEFIISGENYRGVDNNDLCGFTGPEVAGSGTYGLQLSDRHSGIPAMALVPIEGLTVYQVSMNFDEDFPHLLTQRGAGTYDCAKVVNDRLSALEAYTAPAPTVTPTSTATPQP